MKTIEESFQEWNAEVLQGDLGSEAVRLLRDAFYAGAMAALERAVDKPRYSGEMFREFIVETTREMDEHVAAIGEELRGDPQRN